MKQFTFVISAMCEDGEFIDLESKVVAFNQNSAESIIRDYFLIKGSPELININDWHDMNNKNARIVSIKKNGWV